MSADPAEDVRWRVEREEVSTIILIYLAAAAAAVVLVTVGFFLTRSQRRHRHDLGHLRELYYFSSRLDELNDPEELIREVLRTTERLLEADVAELLLVSSDPTSYTLNRQGGLDTTRDNGSAGEQPDNLETISTRLSGRDFGGVLSARRRGEEPTPFNSYEIRLLTSLGAHASSALVTTRRLENLRREASDQRHRADHDSLTGLGNRTLYAKTVATAVATLPEGRLCAVLILDLDGFKPVNDHLGHQSGDRVMQVVADRIRDVVGNDRGQVIRLGGDEFAVVLRSEASRTDVRSLAEEMVSNLKVPIQVGAHNLMIHGSVGVSLAPLDATEPAALLKKADLAMYRAKEMGGAIHFHEDADERSERKQAEMLVALRSAFERNIFDLWYQPIVRLEDNQVLAVEALVRWYDPDLGFVAPDEFIPLAENAGLIGPITWWVLDRALSDAGGWTHGGQPLGVAVNLSESALFSRDLLHEIRRGLQGRSFAAERLSLEITETALTNDPVKARSVLDALINMGVKISVDDFGSGRSTLGVLSQLPFSQLKIDRSFVARMNQDPASEAVVRSATAIGDTLDRSVVAEGVEDAATLSRLRDLGCNIIQGYHLARPMPPASMTTWLNEHNVAPGDNPDVIDIRKSRPA